MAEKSTLRNLMATLEEAATFAAYHEAKSTRANADSAMRTVITTLPDIRKAADAIMEGFKDKTTWDEEKAARTVISLLNKLQPSLEKLTNEEKTAGGANAKFLVKGPKIFNISAQGVKNNIETALKNEQSTGKRRASAYAHDPFGGMDFHREFASPEATLAGSR